MVVHQNGSARLRQPRRRSSCSVPSSTRSKDYYGAPITDFLHPDDIDDMIERLAQLTEPGQFFEHGEVRIVSPDGDHR